MKNSSILSWILMALFCMKTINVFSTTCSSVYLYSQADIDNYPSVYGCDTVDYLYIGYNFIPQLDSLYGIEYVDNFSMSSPIDDYHGLNDALQVRYMQITSANNTEFLNFPSNAVIRNLNIQSGGYSTLNGLTLYSSMDYLRLGILPNLTDLGLLNSVDSFGQLIINQCPRIKNLSLASIAHCDILNIGNCDSLEHISQLGSMTEIGELYIYSCNMLDTLDLPAQIQSISGQLSIQSNSNLVCIDLPNIQSVGQGMALYNLPSLEVLNMNFLASTPYLSSSISIQLCPLLSSVQIPNIGNIKALGNLNLSGVAESVLNAFASIEFANTMTISTTDMVNWPFESIRFIESAWINSNNQFNGCCILYKQYSDGKIGTLSLYGNGVNCSNYLSMVISCGPEVDEDLDGVLDSLDNCISFANPGQSDIDGDGVGDDCDNCPSIFNPDQFDTNNNGIGNACENITYNTKMHVENGDVVIDVSSGLILRGVNDQCYRLRINSSGEVVSVAVPCPSP